MVHKKKNHESFISPVGTPPMHDCTCHENKNGANFFRSLWWHFHKNLHQRKFSRYTVHAYLPNMPEVVQAEVGDSVGSSLNGDGRCRLHPSRSLAGKVSSIGKRVHCCRHQNYLQKGGYWV